MATPASSHAQPGQPWSCLPTLGRDRSPSPPAQIGPCPLPRLLPTGLLDLAEEGGCEGSCSGGSAGSGGFAKRLKASPPGAGGKR